jgi:hypothetical protein
VSSWAAEVGVPRRRATVAGLAGVVVLVALVLVGRWEGERHADAVTERMTETRALIGPLDSPDLSGYRLLEDVDCLVYRRGDNPYALELCVDREGRVVETIDRRRFDRRIDSLRDEPSASDLRVERAVVDRLLERMGVRESSPTLGP